MRTRRATTIKERPALPLTIVGAGRAAREALPALVELDPLQRLAPLFLDAGPGKALALADEAKHHGLSATAWEARIEDVIDELPPEHLQQVLVNLDHGTPIADFLERASSARHVLVYQLVKPALGPLYGLRMYLSPDDPDFRLEAALLFRTFGSYTLRKGSQALIGSQGTYEDQAGEPLLRSWMAEHTRDVLRKNIAQLPPEVAPLEVTDDYGATTMPAYIRGGMTFSDPEILARSILARPAQPMLRGEPFMVIELVPALGIRWHKGRLRNDGRIVTERTATHEWQHRTELPERTNIVAATTTALARAERNEVSATNGMFSTD